MEVSTEDHAYRRRATVLAGLFCLGMAILSLFHGNLLLTVVGIGLAVVCVREYRQISSEVPESEDST